MGITKNSHASFRTQDVFPSYGVDFTKKDLERGKKAVGLVLFVSVKSQNAVFCWNVFSRFPQWKNDGSNSCILVYYILRQTNLYSDHKCTSEGSVISRLVAHTSNTFWKHYKWFKCFPDWILGSTCTYFAFVFLCSCKNALLSGTLVTGNPTFNGAGKIIYKRIC